MRILFICKKNETYGFTTYTRRSSGLFNSTRFIVESLLEKGVHAHIVEVGDNNEIHREAVKFKADIVVIEALWVVPSKFIELQKVMPHVKWFCHLHSHIPFLALEGIAMEWTRKYLELGVGLIANSKPSYKALKAVLGRKGLIYLPNVYISNPKEPHCSGEYHSMWPKAHLDIGCFGAIRPLKNQLLQAMAAIKFAKQMNKSLRFHMNVSRTETGGQPVLKNILELFSNPSHNAVLIQHEWHEPEDFIRQLEMKMDIGMQVSLTETFNVVSADYVTAGIPVVASKEVSWLNPFSKAKDDCIDSIVECMHRALKYPFLIRWNQRLLLAFSKNAQKSWYKFVEKIERKEAFSEFGIVLLEDQESWV